MRSSPDRQEGIDDGRRGLPPARIGEMVHTALSTSRPKTRDVVTPTRLVQWPTDTLPKRVVDRIVAKRVGWR